MFQFINNVVGKLRSNDGEPTIEALVAENQRLGRDIDALREQRRTINEQIAKLIAQGKRG